MIHGTRIDDAALAQLAKYCYRANLMREFVHFIAEESEPNLMNLKKDDWWEFETYLHYWLSALFVLVEAFNKLRIKDAVVRRLFKDNVGQLKLLRHETYHFSPSRPPARLLDQLNWAEQLHNAIHAHVRTIVVRRAQVARLMEFRTQSKKRAL